jgi:predicted nucleic acid-binding protein
VILVDTNVVSELMRPAPAPAVADWIRSQPDREVYTTAITLAEVRYGIERLPSGRRKERLRATADEAFDAFADDVLSFDVAAATEYAIIASSRERAGAPIDGFDGQIAAICRARRAAVATRNGKHFEGTGVDVIDPWTGT